jgi:ABC-2 type transport system permease protein
MRRFFRGLGPLTLANVKSFYRDRGSLFWTFAFPIIFVILFGSIFSSGPTVFSVGWVDEDHTQASQGLREGFVRIELVRLGDADRESALDQMRRGVFEGVVVVPQGFEAGLKAAQAGSRPPIQIELFTDPSRQTASATIKQLVAQVVTGINLSLAGTPPVLDVANEPLQTDNIGTAAYFVPSILAMALMQLGVFAAIPLVSQREKGILKRLNATPLLRATLVGSNILMRLLIALVQTLLILGVGAVLFSVAIIGNLAVAAGLIVLGALTFLSIGYLIASYARTEESANALVSVVQFPLMFLSGIFFPITFMPSWLQPIASLLPLTYLGDALRQVMVGGSAYAPLIVDVGVLAAWLGACFLLSARFFRWQ